MLSAAEIIQHLGADDNLSTSENNLYLPIVLDELKNGKVAQDILQQVTKPDKNPQQISLDYVQKRLARFLEAANQPENTATEPTTASERIWSNILELYPELLPYWKKLQVADTQLADTFRQEILQTRKPDLAEQTYQDLLSQFLDKLWDDHLVKSFASFLIENQQQSILHEYCSQHDLSDDIQKLENLVIKFTSENQLDFAVGEAIKNARQFREQQQKQEKLQQAHQNDLAFRQKQRKNQLLGGVYGLMIFLIVIALLILSFKSYS